MRNSVNLPGELRERVRGISEVPGRGYKDDSVTVVSRDSWIVRLDLVADEYYHTEPVKRALVRYPLKDCALGSEPGSQSLRSGTRLLRRYSPTPGSGPGRTGRERKDCSDDVYPLSSFISGPVGPVCAVSLPVEAVELMKWERIPLQVPLTVGQERIVFVNKNVRVGFSPGAER